MSDTAQSNHPHTNRLAAESSPYLLQHAHNPVDWYAWGPEAFERATRENKPIFLSVGYSTCYWCHVMERQSFENEAIAAEMNQRFVCIKVDREERPDVDSLYMNAVQIITRQGGWPMSVFLTPDLRPFYGGTYFPPTDSHGRPGFPRLLVAIEDAYKNRREEVEKSAEQITNILRQMARPPATAAQMTIDMQWVRSHIERSAADYDSAHGGFGSAPKFPRQTVLELLLVYLRDNDHPTLMKQVLHTLDAMANGGIRDHLGGGFHRYSTDAQWLVPHFEIMLYDNAMLAWIYTEAYRQTEDLRYAAIARGICDFVLREMTSADGAFYTAFDAEVDAQEGLSYLWTKEQVEKTLGAKLGSEAREEIDWFCNVYGLNNGPNFADPHHGTGLADQNILYLAQPATRDASALLDTKLRTMREILYDARRGRKQPMLDTKIITSWNALMIRALAYAGDVLHEDRYLKAADTCAAFLLQRHRDGQGNVFRTSRDGAAKTPGFLDDYAFLSQALLALDDAGDNELRADQAGEIATIMQQKFGDEESGGFYFTEENAADLIVRQMSGTDNPLPSGNGVAATAILQLGKPDIARKTLETFAEQLDQVGEGMSALVQAAYLYVRQHGPIKIEPARSAQADRPLSPAQVAAQIVSIRPAWADATQLNLHVNILKGFHINAHVASAGLLATQLSVSGNAAEDVVGIDYPPGEEESFAFTQEPLRVYTGDVLIAVRFKSPQLRQDKVEISLYYQACDENACLPPVSKMLEVTTP